MKNISDKEKKIREEELNKAKELKQKIESIKNDLISKTKIIKTLTDEREIKIENMKKLEIENKMNYDNFINQYKQILCQYKNIEEEFYTILSELKTVAEKSYNEILELRKEKENINLEKNNIIIEKQNEYENEIKKIKLQTIEQSDKINNVLIKINEIFKKSHVQYEIEQNLKPLLIRLNNIDKENDEII